MITSASIHKVAGLEIIDTPCSKCGSAMFIKICPCFLRRKGWETCARCVKCGEQIGLTKRERRKR